MYVKPTRYIYAACGPLLRVGNVQACESRVGGDKTLY